MEHEPISSRPIVADMAGHIQETVATLAELHREHHRSSTRLQKLLDRLTAALGRPASMVVVVALIATWIAVSQIRGYGRTMGSLDWLELMVSIFAMIIAILILITQRREDELAERRAQFTLELALLSDKKSSKIISLLEEMRRDHPEIADRFDAESEEMSRPSDTVQVLAALEEHAAQPT
jgi:uncharacterized membrane protein